MENFSANFWRKSFKNKIVGPVERRTAVRLYKCEKWRKSFVFEGDFFRKCLRGQVLVKILKIFHFF